MGLLPTYQSIGIATPLLLVLLRLAQGFGLGGEWGGAVLMAVEHAPPNRRGFYGSWPQVGAYIGLLLSTIVFRWVSRFPEQEFLSWAWRLPFLFSFILVGVGPLHPQEGLRVSGLRQGQGAEAGRAHALSRGARPSQEDRAAGNGRALRRERAVLCLHDVCAHVHHHHAQARPEHRPERPAPRCRHRDVRRACVGRPLRQDRPAPRLHLWRHRLRPALVSFLLPARDPAALADPGGDRRPADHRARRDVRAASQLLLGLFTARIRYSGASLGYQLASVLAGGLAPLVATGLLAWTGGATWGVGLYMVALVVITVVSVGLSAETFKSGIGPEANLVASSQPQPSA